MRYILSVLLMSLLFSIVAAFSNHKASCSFPDSTRLIKNQLILNYVKKYGPTISSTYEKAVCTELVIKVLQNFVVLSKEEKKRIRIITDKNLTMLRLSKSPIPAGVHYALTSSGKGKSIDTVDEVKPGDFVQFWTLTWGHCGIVKSIDAKAMTMELYSSFPSSKGYGILTFDIPDECYFVRLK